MLGPNVILFTIFVGIPIIGAFALSLFAWTLSGTPTWVGLANYTAMFKDPLVAISVKNTLYFVAMGVLPTVFISLGLAMLINFNFRGITIVRSLYLVPAAVSLAADEGVVNVAVVNPGQAASNPLPFTILEELLPDGTRGTADQRSTT